MSRAVLFDLFNTLVPGGSDTERTQVTRAMGTMLGVDRARKQSPREVESLNGRPG